MTSRQLRRFGLTVAVPFGLLSVVGAWRGHTVFPIFFASLTASLGGLALLAPGVLAPVEKVWMGAAHILGRFNTRVILSVVYVLVMTPTGLLMRLLGRDPLDRRLRDRPSYWVTRERRLDPKGSMERQF